MAVERRHYYRGYTRNRRLVVYSLVHTQKRPVIDSAKNLYTLKILDSYGVFLMDKKQGIRSLLLLFSFDIMIVRYEAIACDYKQ